MTMSGLLLRVLGLWSGLTSLSGAWGAGGAAPGTPVLAGATEELRPAGPQETTLGQDLERLRGWGLSPIVLSSGPSGPCVVVLSEAQGRVMSSSTRGLEGRSLGWVPAEAPANDRAVPPMDLRGGEDCFWLGPEGSQFSLFFPPGAPWVQSEWRPPALLETQPFQRVGLGSSAVEFRAEGCVVNAAGQEFQVGVQRQLRLLDRSELALALGVELGELSAVGYESRNLLVNQGERTWSRETGLLSIRVLGRFPPEPDLNVIVPLREGEESELGPAFRHVGPSRMPADRCRVLGGQLLFRGDGLSRGRVGIGPRRSAGRMGSWDPGRGVLSVVEVQPSSPPGLDRAESEWGWRKSPFRGDAISGYNDGPSGPGSPPLGPFYELESSSPARALAPGERMLHVRRTVHLEGARSALDAVARQVLGLGLAAIESALD